MGVITYAGLPPFGLLGVQSGSADAAGDTVEMTLHISDPDLSPVMERIHIPLSARAAGFLGKALQSAAIDAEANARRK
jgi:hypothetical protein